MAADVAAKDVLLKVRACVVVFFFRKSFDKDDDDDDDDDDDSRRKCSDEGSLFCLAIADAAPAAVEVPVVRVPVVAAPVPVLWLRLRLEKGLLLLPLLVRFVKLLLR